MRAAGAALVWSASLAATIAPAHAAIEGVGGFAGGVLHPLLVPSHAVSLVALALAAGRLPRPLHRAILTGAFAAGLVLALALIVNAVAAFDMDVALLACALSAAMATALGFRAPLVLAAPVTVAAAAALLLDSVPRIVSARETLIALAGTMVAAWLTYALIATLTAEPNRAWFRFGVRLAASWIAAGVLVALALRLTGAR